MIPDMLKPWMTAAAVLGVSLALGYFARAVLIRRLTAIAERTKTDLDDLFVESVRSHVPLWFLLGGILVAEHVAPLSQTRVDTIGRIVAAAFMMSISWAASNFVVGWVQRTARRSGAAAATTSLSQNVVRIAVLGIGVMLVLSNLGVEVTPLLTALGIGSLAIALALQPTLSNLFAGVHLTVSRPIKVGDFVEIEGNTTGYVIDIGWRATRIRELANNVIVVPNARLAEMVLRNYSLPEPEGAALVQMGVAYGSDLPHVERVTCEVARDVLREIPGGIPEFEPFIRYNTFGDSSINFTVILRVREYTDRFLVVHEFVKRIKARFDLEGIEIPFPQRVLSGNLNAVIRRPDHGRRPVDARGKEVAT